MKFTQQEGAFRPIAVVFETSEEAELFWKIVREMDDFPLGLKERGMLTKISNYFSNEAKL